MGEHTEWFSRAKNSDDQSHKIFNNNSLPLGLLSYTNIDRTSQQCHWGFYLGYAGLPGGTGLMMGFLGLNFAFEEIGVRKLIGEVLEFNKVSRSFHHTLGFTEVDTMFKHILKSDIYVDVIRFEILKENWLNLRAEIEVKLRSKSRG